MEELDLLQEDFERYYLSLDAHMLLPRVKRMVIQADLVIRRISSEANYSGNPDWLYCNAVAAVSLKLANRATRSLTGLPDVSCSHPAPISGSYSSGRSSYSSDHSRIKESPHLAVGASESMSLRIHLMSR
jgi:hypothetical protein